MTLKKQTWKKYTIDFLSIFIAVVSAFALNNWNDNRRDNNAESRILSEILNGLDKDLADAKLNETGHNNGIIAVKYWRDIITDQPVNQDSLRQYYFNLTRDFVSIQNTSGYETLKSKGLEIIKNDSLRSMIISLYEYDYKTLMKLEEEYNELQFQENYFYEINKIVAPNFRFDPKGNISGIDLPLKISKSERNLLLSYLWKIQTNRRFILLFYTEIEGKINKISTNIKKELNR